MMNNENGRSMVEMLGVLAIIGVLSVAGIAGYTMAMNKYKANEVTNAAAQLAILAEAKFATSGSTFSGYDATKLGYKDSDKIGGLSPSAITASVNSSGVVTVAINCGGSDKDPCKTINVAIPGNNKKIGQANLTLS